MSKDSRENLPRVNFFDGQRVTESDLDIEQIHHRNLASNIILDFHQSGVVKSSLFESRVLFDSSMPGEYSDEESLSKQTIEAGEFDGTPIYIDRQPSDTVYGNRIEVSAEGLDIGGRIKAKVLIVGLRYSSSKVSGELVTELLEFDKNQTKVTRNFYIKVVSVLFNNLSGGLGSTHYLAQKESVQTNADGGKIILRESEPLKVFVKTETFEQVESPNYGLATFITSSEERTIRDELRIALGSKYNLNEIYFELDSSRSMTFGPLSSQNASYGQKFLSKSNNLQRVDVLLYVEEDQNAEPGFEYDFSGELVFSLHRLLDGVSCITDPNPENLLDFDPDPSPIVEISYSKEDLLEMGVRLDGNPQIVSVDFSATLIANPAIEPSLEVDSYYAVLISRRGDNSVGTVGVPAGYYKPSRKRSNGQDLNPHEQFSRQTYRLIEYDATNLSYVDYQDLSMWIVIHSNSIEITDGHAYSDDGIPMAIPKTVEYVGSTRIPLITDAIDLVNVGSESHNYIALYREDRLIDSATHPRTGNFVNTKIQDYPAISVLTESELSSEMENDPILLARVIDQNIKNAQPISGALTQPGLLGQDFAMFINPSEELLGKNLTNRIFVPDEDCQCNSRYRITGTSCSVLNVGDLNNDGSFGSEDITMLLDVVGNTLTAATTQRKILNGELSLVDFIKSDLNDDGTVDGDDIELLEDAIDGYINFSADEQINVLTLHLENILEEDDFPVLFDSSLDSSTALSGVSIDGGDELSFSIDSEESGMSIRPGDRLEISSDSADSGIYIIYGKTIDFDNLTATVTVMYEDEEAVEFVGSSGFDVSVISGSPTNMFANNQDLLKVPFSSKSWSIFQSSSHFSESQIDFCDLRRFVETNFIEESINNCLCESVECIQPEVCGPILKNQKVLPNDLFIPDGEIYSRPGIPYHGDIEYSNISIPLPPGSIDDCQINLYENFIKGYEGTCTTASGYPAMQFSDGTYVGCEDSGGETDITKGRVKISQAIGSLYVDAFVDGYATDGYADESETSVANEVISETFTDYSYPATGAGFSDWPTVDPSGGTYFTINTPASSNSPASLLLQTINTGNRKAGITHPSSVDPISGDFVVDFSASRLTWESASLLSGNIEFYGELVVTNDDGTSCDVRLGWRVSAGGKTMLFFSGRLYNTSTGSTIGDFDESIEAKDDILDVVSFRIRRTNEAIFGMYFDKTAIDEDSIDGKYIKVGSAPTLSPGSGDASMSFYLEQTSSPNSGIVFYGKVHSAIIRSGLSSSDLTEASEIEIGRDSLGEMDRATFGFPILLTQRTNIVSAYLEIDVTQDYSGGDSFNIIPLEVLNADNLGRIIDYPSSDNNSIITSFSPGVVSSGETLVIDVTPMAIYFLSRTGHLPGFSKAFVLEPDSSATSSLFLEPTVSFIIEYEDLTSGVIFKIGTKLDSKTGIVSFNTKNILYDSVNVSNRTILNFGVYLKKSGFRNDDISIGIKDLEKLGIGTCKDEAVFNDDELCFFITGSTATGTFVQGPFPCYFHLP